MRILLKLLTLSILFSSIMYATDTKSDLKQLQKVSQATKIEFNKLLKESKKDEIVKLANEKLRTLDSVVRSTKNNDKVKYDWARHEYLDIAVSSMILNLQYTYDKDFAISVLNSIPPTSDIWEYGIVSSGIPFVVAKQHKLDKEQYIDSMLLYHPNQKLRAKLINDLFLFTKNTDPEEYDHYYGILLKMQDIQECRELKKNIDKGNPNIGKSFPSSGFIKSDEKAYNIKFKNYDYYVVDCWTTWCSSCIREMEEMQQIYLSQDTSKIKFIGICLDDKLKKGKSIVEKKFHKNWLSLYLIGQNQESFRNEFNIHSYPYKMVLDSQGKLLYDKVYIFELEALLRQIQNQD